VDVEDVVLTTSALVKVGEPDEGLKEHVVPESNVPAHDTLKLTD